MRIDKIKVCAEDFNMVHTILVSVDMLKGGCVLYSYYNAE